MNQLGCRRNCDCRHAELREINIPHCLVQRSCVNGRSVCEAEYAGQHLNQTLDDADEARPCVRQALNSCALDTTDAMPWLQDGALPRVPITLYASLDKACSRAR